MIAQPRPCYQCGAPFARPTGIRCAVCYPVITTISGRASNRVNRAIAAGELPALSDGLTTCVDCGEAAKQYEHRDYSRPLDVVPVCRRCNRARGPALPASVELLLSLKSALPWIMESRDTIIRRMTAPSKGESA